SAYIMKPSLDVTRSVTISAGNINGLTCGLPVTSQTLTPSWYNIRVPEPLYPLSQHVITATMELRNGAGSALLGGSDDDPDFGIAVYVSSDDTVDDDDIQLNVTIATADVEKTYNGINAGGSVLIGITVTIDSDVLDHESCLVIKAGEPQVLLAVENIRSASGYTSTGVATALINSLLCQFAGNKL
ncbi:unnamed protein product, partial [Owenia fusiformis]